MDSLDDLILIRKETKERYKISKIYKLDTPNGETPFAEVYQIDKKEKDFFENVVYFSFPVSVIKDYFIVESV